MALELVLELESSASSSVELNAGVARNSQHLLVCGERVVCDRVVEKVVNFWCSHFDSSALIGGALYYQVG